MFEGSVFSQKNLFSYNRIHVNFFLKSDCLDAYMNVVVPRHRDFIKKINFHVIEYNSTA